MISKLISLFLLCLLLVGCDDQVRNVMDCRQCDGDEFCIDRPGNNMGLYEYQCVKYGNNKEVKTYELR